MVHAVPGLAGVRGSGHFTPGHIPFRTVPLGHFPLPFTCCRTFWSTAGGTCRR